MSLKFVAADRPTQLFTHNLEALCDYLTVKVMEPFLAAQGTRWDPRFHDFFAHGQDSHPYEATGTIDFLVPGMYDCKVGEFENAILAELRQLGLTTGTIQRETHPGSMAVRVVHIPIVKNPTALSGPPEVNVSPNAGRLILRDLLGFQPHNGTYEFGANDLLKRLSSVKPEAVAKCGAAPVWDQKQDSQPLRASAPKTVQLVDRCLKEIGAFADWAHRNQYQKLQVS